MGKVVGIIAPRNREVKYIYLKFYRPEWWQERGWVFVRIIGDWIQLERIRGT
jgi:hypothetical protein